MERTFSTAEVSRMWNVSESTVKRWANSGALECIKTPGGHRRFSMNALVKFQRDHNIDESGWIQSVIEIPVYCPKTESRPEPFRQRLESALAADDLPALQDLYFETATQGNDRAAWEILLRTYMQGYQFLELMEKLLTPVLHRIGELWRKGDLSIYEEHLASRITIDATHRLHLHIQQKTANGRVALCCCPEGDLHEVALHWLSQALEEEGWDVVSMGANTPIFSLTDALHRFAPDLLCISATVLTDLERLRRDYAHCWKVTRNLETKVVIGGAAFEDETTRHHFPHDFHGKSLSDLMGYLRREFS